MKKLLAAIAAVVVVVVVLVVARRGSHPAKARASPPPPGVAASTPWSGSADLPARVKRITPDERRVLEQKIAAAQAARSARAASSAPERPTLPPRHEGGLEDLPPGALELLDEALPFLGACYGNGARMTGPHQALVLVSLHGDPDVGTLIDPGEMHDENGAAIDPEIASCLTTTLESLQLPPMGDGRTVNVQFTFRY